MDKNGPFQSFDDVSDAATCAPRLAALRAELDKRGLDGFVIPHSDEHQSEYLPARAERLAWLTAFTGSAGAAVVLKHKAVVFTDGRYTLQVARQTDTKLFEPRDLVAEGPQGWIPDHLTSSDKVGGAKLGYDPWLSTVHGAFHLKNATEKAGGTLVALDSNPVDAIWSDQPPPPTGPVMVQPAKLAGESSESKRTRLAEGLKKAGADAAAITLADSLCWLLNIRGSDVPHTPFVLAFALLNSDATVDLFLDANRCGADVIAHLGGAVRLHASANFGAALDGLNGKKIVVDPASAASAIQDRLHKAGAVIRHQPDPCQLPKACKNAAEVEGMRQAHIRDGSAMARFLCWLETAAAGGTLTEIVAAEALEGFRRATGCLADLSFDSISGAGSNGAIVHYRVTRSTNRVLAKNEIFLIDSGAQYPDGTTDITRTVMIGTANAEMKDRFTRVLKGHIALATARFPDGTTGMQLDAFARRPLWEAGLDYDHGTGHGVGSYLAVHEGPQNISKRPVNQKLMPGMICSNEPGFYKEGAFGIRLENLVVVTEARDVAGGERKMMEFETITLAPLDLNLVEASLLTGDERAWLNAYHQRVRETVGPLVDSETRGWLEKATKSI